MHHALLLAAPVVALAHDLWRQRGGRYEIGDLGGNWITGIEAPHAETIVRQERKLLTVRGLYRPL